jgi:putative transposase
MHVAGLAVELDQLSLKSSQTARRISSSRERCRSVNTRCRYFVTKTKWARSSNAQCLPVRIYGDRVQLRYAYRLNPTPGQRIALAKAFGCARVVFNNAIAARRAAHAAGAPYPTDAELSRALTAAKRTPERAWLAEVPAVVLQQALADANSAYRNFFASLSGKRNGRKLGAPRFRSRKDRAQSIRFTRAARFRVTDAGRLRLPGIGDVPVRWSRDLPGDPSSVTVTVDATGRYHASFVVEVPDQPLPPNGREMGIDLGLAHFAVLSDGRKIDNPRYGRKAAAKLRRAQKELARRQRGSANRAKSRRKVARCHARVGDTRRDWLHKLSTTIIRENQAVYVEDLAVSGLARTRLARSVHDAGWSTFVAMLEYKAARHGRMFAKVDRWFPSTRSCSACGAMDETKPLHVREWVCPCGAVHDRDVNAALNILAAGRAESRQTPVELVSDGTPVPQPAMKQEPAGSAA